MYELFKIQAPNFKLSFKLKLTRIHLKKVKFTLIGKKKKILLKSKTSFMILLLILFIFQYIKIDH